MDQAAQANINLTIDAEESDRLELSLDLLDTVAAHIARQHPQWQGFGLAVQAYQTRARQVVDEVARIARLHGLRFMVRLVKGAFDFQARSFVRSVRFRSDTVILPITSPATPVPGG